MELIQTSFDRPAVALAAILRVRIYDLPGAGADETLDVQSRPYMEHQREAYLVKCRRASKFTRFSINT